MTREEREDVIQYLENLRLIQSDNFMKEGISKAIEALRQEPILDKIMAEIEEAQTYDGIYIDRAYVLEIIDKYKAESEE